MSGFAFVCAFEESDDWVRHETTGSMVQCPRCRRFAVAGYLCETCGHEDVDKPNELTGHGEGKCSEPAS